MKIIEKLIVIFFLFNILLMASCTRSAPEEKNMSDDYCIPDSLMNALTFDTLRSGSVMSELSLPGKITFNEDHVVKVFSPVGGRVSDVKVTLGDYVEKGQLLAVLRSTDMAGYYNDYQSAQSDLAVAKKNLEASADLKSSGVASEKDYITAQSEYRKALAQYNKVNEVMKIYGNTLPPGDSVGSGYQLKAPISGFIVEKNISAGLEMHSDMGTNLFTISDLKDMWAVASVYETDIAKIKTGDEAMITALSYPDKKFNGKVEKISNVLDPETKVMSVKIHLDNSDYTLKPGMFANVSILFPENKKMLMVPSRSVLFDDNKNYVVHFHKRCDVDMQQVSIFKSFNDQCYVIGDSLQEGDLVINRNALFVLTALKKL
ncbi:MAG: efflux RND transporter periplasmic adaptor subunit [Bacteroidetes bacterium]|nr:efflux RND transporter periplasmic adaptor subunit [Bacteroidota bacterium]